MHTFRKTAKGYVVGIAGPTGQITAIGEPMEHPYEAAALASFMNGGSYSPGDVEKLLPDPKEEDKPKDPEANMSPEARKAREASGYTLDGRIAPRSTAQAHERPPEEVRKEEEEQREREEHEAESGDRDHQEGVAKGRQTPQHEKLPQHNEQRGGKREHAASRKADVKRAKPKAKKHR